MTTPDSITLICGVPLSSSNAEVYGFQMRRRLIATSLHDLPDRLRRARSVDLADRARRKTSSPLLYDQRQIHLVRQVERRQGQIEIRHFRRHAHQRADL
jgi:hypothetical protein